MRYRERVKQLLELPQSVQDAWADAHLKQGETLAEMLRQDAIFQRVAWKAAVLAATVAFPGGMGFNTYYFSGAQDLAWGVLVGMCTVSALMFLVPVAKYDRSKDFLAACRDLLGK